MALDNETREAFLAEPHIGVLAVAAEQDRGPLAVPIWYGYEPGGELWVLTAAASPKARLVGAAGRFTMCVEQLTPRVRYVSVEGPVTRTVPGTERDLVEMAQRYLPPDQVADFVAMSTAEHGEQVRIHLRPEHWLSADMGPG